MNEEGLNVKEKCEIKKNTKGYRQKIDNTGIYSTLANLPADALIDEVALARAFGVSTRTVRRMVSRYELPPPIRVAGRSIWISSNVIAWLKDMAEKAEKNARKAAEQVRRYNT